MNLRVARAVARHALGWLVLANAVGVWLAALLLWPGLNDLAVPFTYGRWMPLHLNWHLYGWCALPLVGVLIFWILTPDDAAGARQARWAVVGWSAALAIGGASWLGGCVSGKLFLDWSGWARLVLPVAMLFLWSVLGAATWARRRALSRRGLLARLAALAGLLAVPSLLFWAMAREVYPSVNPDSGGATGASLLGSTLSIVAIAGWAPRALRLKKKPAARASEVGFWGAFALSAFVYAVMDRGHASHHVIAQIWGLATLLVWAPLLVLHYRGFELPAESARWLAAALAWWTLLLVSGWVTFLPGVSEAVKFTNVLVGHAHLAMAGAVTNFGAALLVLLGCGPRARGAAFWAWQVAGVVHVGALGCLGILETRDTGSFFTGVRSVEFLLALRLASGAAMFAASIAWWWQAGVCASARVPERSAERGAFA